MQDQALRRAAVVVVTAVVVSLVSLGGAEVQPIRRVDVAAKRVEPEARSERPVSPAGAASVGLQPAGAAFFIRNLTTPRERREARADVLDTPTLPGSVIKALTLVTALETGAITTETGAMCRRAVTVDGVRFVCSHPDLKRPLSPAEALAHSCNDFFVSLAPRLSRERVNATRIAAGLPPISPATLLAPALVGLDGPRVTPRALVDVLARVAGVGPDRAVPMRPETKAVLLEGLAGAAAYGTASALGERGVKAWAKTGTAPMPGGGAAGLVVALVPAPQPTHGVVVVAPGGAGLDAASIAADVVQQAGVVLGQPTRTPSPSSAVPAPATGAVAGGQAVSGVQRGEPIRLGRIQANGSARVETVALEDYLSQVLAGEGQPSAAPAAQQALAVAARTFVLANRNRHRREGFDVCDTTHCQVLRRATPATREAVAATSGQVLLQGGRPAQVFYSASCGGRIERASQVWPGSSDLAHPDRDDADEDEPAWVSEVRAQDLERALRAAGLRGGRVRGLRVVQRNQSGRVVRLRVDGFSPPEIAGTDLRMAIGRVLGWQYMKSTAFDVERTGAGYRFRGRGHGHGVGLCVIGAGVRASRGATAADILTFYFPGVPVGSVGTPATASAAATASSPAPAPAPESAAASVSSPRVAVPTTAARSDVQVALPAHEESERTALIGLIRQARDEIARATGQKAPPVLRVTVHPTVDSFGRATGQPWWVSGATVGADIALLSLATLRQQGQMERTVRHEVVHAMLDAPLANRPLWVREGAAIYFARPAPADGPKSTGRVTCPSDGELLQPISAGAQRDAYARAEACFVRQIAAGRSWSEVR